MADAESLMGDAPLLANGDAVDEEAMENEYEDKIKDCIEGCQSKRWVDCVRFRGIDMNT